MKNRRPWVLYAAAAGVAGLVVIMAWANQDRLRPVEVGGPAPAFSAVDLSGTPRSLADYRGKVVLLNIWATWCAPCKEEMPSIQRLRDSIEDDNFQVLAVSIDRAPANDEPANPLGGKLRAYADSLGFTFTILHDPSGQISTIFRTTGVPESFVLDREGMIQRKVTGPMAWDAPQNVQLVQRLLAEGSGADQ